MGFASSISKNVERIKIEIQNKSYGIVFSLFNRIIRATPVLDGYLKNNWMTSPNASFSTSTNSIPDTDGSGSLLNVQSLKNADLFYGKNSICTMANNLNYAYRVEYLHWSPKAPMGMVRISLTDVAAENK
jgi:hypothetical protein